jgi:DNA helicase HerA-like ATPase
MERAITLPGIEDRTLIIGRTGSGKTYAGVWLLSQMPIEDMPWIVFDFKGDKSIARIPFAQVIDLNTIPTVPGVYIVRPLPGDDDKLQSYLQQIWDTEGIGLYIDEAFQLAKNTALDAILIQGRSKNIPVIMLTQRPVGISRFAFSESQFLMVFPNHDKRERKTISEFTPLFQSGDLEEHLLPRFHSYWYDVIGNTVTPLKPVPKLESIIKVFDAKLRPPEPLEMVPVQRMRFSKI